MYTRGFYRHKGYGEAASKPAPFKKRRRAAHEKLAAFVSCVEGLATRRVVQIRALSKSTDEELTANPSVRKSLSISEPLANMKWDPFLVILQSLRLVILL